MGTKYGMVFLYEDDCSVDEEIIRYAENVFAHFGDDISRKIYENRILASLTMNIQYMREVILTVPENRELFKELEKCKKVYVYGAGTRGNRVVKLFPKIIGGGVY